MLSPNDIPKIVPYKYKVPLLWVDTNVIINMARALHGAPMNDIDRKRAVRIYDRVFELAENGSLVYMDANQRREYGTGAQLVKECDELQSRLSRGNKAQHPLHIRQEQLHRMMAVYLGKEREFVMKDFDIFHRDPLEEHERLKELGIIVSYRHTISDAERAEDFRIRDKIVTDWEFLRQEKRKDAFTFQQALDLEYQAEWFLIRRHIADAAAGKQPSDPLAPLYRFQLLQSWFFESGVHPSNATAQNIADFANFMHSRAYREIPNVNTNSRLLAYLVTTTQPVQRGDYGDIEHVSAFLPYCSVMIVDRAMKHRIIELRLDKKYETKILSLRDEVELDTFFDSIA